MKSSKLRLYYESETWTEMGNSISKKKSVYCTYKINKVINAKIKKKNFISNIIYLFYIL